MRLLYNVIETDMGWVAVAGLDGGIAHLVLPCNSKSDAERQLAVAAGFDLAITRNDFSGEAQNLEAYFSGRRTDFTCSILAPDASSFDLAVWKAAREIPYGGLSTYGALADNIDRPRAARAVGNALGRNPVPVVVPSHRILRSDGGLGGFSGGLHWKTDLLGLEDSLGGIRL
jgi:methylated-DNA-[protein]-cysteine S-methyltransferase